MACEEMYPQNFSNIKLHYGAQKCNINTINCQMSFKMTLVSIISTKTKKLH